MKQRNKKIVTCLLISFSLIISMGSLSVAYADSDGVRSVIPNDMGYVSGEQWAINKISLPAAWEIEKGNQLLVGVIDSGIDASHPDLQGRIDTNLSQSFVAGYDPLEDATGHGTHVAGIIAARTNNSIGIAGVCWNVRLVSLRVVGSDPRDIDNSAIIAAINYAKAEGIKLLNFSNGPDAIGVDYSEVDAAIKDYPGLIVCATSERKDWYPSDYVLEPWINYASNAIVVGASTEFDQPAEKTGRGYMVDVFAPGEDILSCYPTELCDYHDANDAAHHSNGYHYMDGTSMAAPYVTGVAALIMSENPALPVSTIKQIILRTADTVYDENGNNVFGDWCVSGGRLNAGAALRACHMHDLDESVSECDHEWHTVVCETCGACDIEQPHSYIPTHETVFPGYTMHYGLCSCGYELEEGVYCVYDLYVSVSQDDIEMHRIYCACGQYIEKRHVYIAYDDPNDDYYWICLYCNKKVDVEWTTWQDDVDELVATNTTFPVSHAYSENRILWVLTETGSFMTPNGAIVLSPEDAALVEAGSLNPYSLINDIIYDEIASD